MNISIISLLFFVFLVLFSLYLQGYFQKPKYYKFENFPKVNADHFRLTVASLSDSLIVSGNITNFWVGATEIYSARLKAIEMAKRLIQVETYIMTPGSRADEFSQAIIEKAKKGVKVQLLVDNYGTKSLPNSYWKKLKTAGVEVRKFNQFDWRNPLKSLRRNHRKLLIIDNKIALIGGAGISDRWDGWSKIGDQEPWLDYEVAIQGNIIARLSGLFWQHWIDTGGIVNFAQVYDKKPDNHLTETLVTANDYPTYQDSSIRALFQALILGSTQRLWIASPYFLPNDNSCKMLVDAKNREVDVKVLTMGKHCDKGFVRQVSRERYGELLRGKIAIHEYQPSMVHAKIVLVDDCWVSLGSANFDPRSFFYNDELNISINDNNLIKEVEKFFIQGFHKSEKIRITDWENRSFSNRLNGSLWSLFYWQL